MHDVERFTIRPDERMCIVKSVQCRYRDMDGELDRNASSGFAQKALPPAEMKAVDVLQNHQVRIVFRRKIENAHDSRMPQIGHDAGLAGEHPHQLIVAHQRWEDSLDDRGLDEAFGSFVAGEINDAHATRSEAVDDTIAPENAASDEGV